MSIIKLAVMKNDNVYIKAFAKRMKNKDPENMLDVISANKGAAKTRDRYKRMVRNIRKRNVLKVVKGVSAIAGAIGAKKYLYDRYMKKDKES